MVAKMLLLAASASLALASASARTLSQEKTIASAYQLTRASPAENDAEGTTETQTLGPEEEAYADAEGYAGFVIAPGGEGSFAEARTQADLTVSYYSEQAGADGQATAISVSLSDGAAESDADAYAEGTVGETTGTGTSTSAISRSQADGNDFAGANTVAVSLGRRGGTAEADSLALSEEFAVATAIASSEALNGEPNYIASSDASAVAVADGDAEAEYAKAYSAAYSFATQTPLSASFGSTASDASASSIAFNDADAESLATATARAERGVVDAPPGVATSRATSRASGNLSSNGGPGNEMFVGMNFRAVLLSETP